MTRTSSVYLNNAATAWPRARGVTAAVTAALRAMPLHPGRTVTRQADAIVECRARLAAVLGAVPERIALTTNATQALNLAILGLNLPEGAHAVTTVMEHNSVLRPLARLKRDRAIRLTVIGLDSDGALDAAAFARALEDTPALVAVTHASNVTGRINNVEPLFEQAKRAGAITLLDASQSLGHVPVNPIALHADLVAFTGHKGLRGPAGTGGLYVSPALELAQVVVGGTGVRSNLEHHPPEMPMRLEAGTPNVPALAGLAAALRWHEKAGAPFHAQEADMAARLRAGLTGIPGVRVFDTAAPGPRTGIVSFQIPGWDVEEAGFILTESFGIVCRTGLHCAPLIHDAIGSAPQGTIRFSVSGFTRPGEIRAALRAVKALAS